MFKQKCVGKGRPTDMVKLDDGTVVKFKVWVKETEEGKAYLKANPRVKKVKVLAQDASPVATVASVTPVIG